MVKENIGQSGCRERLGKLICTMIFEAGSGHYASSMSALDILYPLVYEQNVPIEQIILSKGHAAPALYAILYDKGYIDDALIHRFREYGGLPGHPSLETKGVAASSGSLGMGISKALGLAYANPDKTYHVIVGDGELQEGQNWEALRYFIECDLTNIEIHVDSNGQQYSGEVTNNIIIESDYITYHKTKWRESNKYLTRPQNPEYAKLIKAYSKALFKLMAENPDIVVLDADLLYDFGLEKIREAYPDRFIECGISEQHMVSMANGLALAGKLPICHTFGAFYRRCIDQIYNNCCDNLKIIYVAGLCGQHKQNIGKSHESTGVRVMMDEAGCISYSSDKEIHIYDLMQWVTKNKTKYAYYVELVMS